MLTRIISAWPTQHHPLPDRSPDKPPISSMDKHSHVNSCSLYTHASICFRFKILRVNYNYPILRFMTILETSLIFLNYTILPCQVCRLNTVDGEWIFTLLTLGIPDIYLPPANWVFYTMAHPFYHEVPQPTQSILPPSQPKSLSLTALSLCPLFPSLTHTCVVEHVHTNPNMSHLPLPNHSNWMEPATTTQPMHGNQPCKKKNLQQ